MSTGNVLRVVLRVVLRPGLVAALSAALALSSSGCGKDKAKAEEAKKSDPTPIPSGLVFNDFVPATGSGAGLGVRDADAGALADIGGGASAEAAPEGAPADKLKVTEPGAEPRAVRKYTFTPNRVDKRVLTITQSHSDGQGPAQEITIKLTLDLAVKQAKPSGATIEAKVAKVELPGAPPQAGQMLASMTGLSGSFDVTPQGDVGEVSFGGTPQMQNQLAESVVQAMSQAVQLLLAPFPSTPVGVGAKWEMGEGGDPAGEGEQGTKRFTLKQVSGEGAVVDADIAIKVPRRAAKGPGGVPVYVEVDGNGHYAYEVRFDRPSTKVDGELTVKEKLEVSDPRGGGKQSVTRLQKGKYLIEAPQGATK